MRDQNDWITALSKQSAMLPNDDTAPDALARSVNAEPPCPPRPE